MIRMTDDAERGFIARAQAGDHRAFAELVRMYQDSVFRFILRLNGARDEAMDLTQETFMKAHQALPGWRPEAQFRTWLFSIAHNATLDVLRRRQRVEFVSASDLAAGEEGYDTPDPARQPDQRLADRQDIELLERTLREFEDMSYGEIAATLGIAEGTVKSRLARAPAAPPWPATNATPENTAMTEQPTRLHVPDLPALSAYLDGELDAGARRRVAAHLATCPACTAYLARLEALSSGLRALPEETLGFDLAGLIEGRLAVAPRRPAARSRRDWQLGWPIAVGAAASIAVGAFMGSTLVAGGAATAPRVAALSVFDSMPPGNLCIGLDSCYLKGSLK